MRATWFERPAIVWPNPATGAWQGLVGIPVDAKPGTHILSIEATTPDGAAPHWSGCACASPPPASPRVASR